MFGLRIAVVGLLVKKLFGMKHTILLACASWSYERFVFSESEKSEFLHWNANFDTLFVFNLLLTIFSCQHLHWHFNFDVIKTITAQRPIRHGFSPSGDVVNPPGGYDLALIIWAPSSEFVSSSIPSWQILTAHAQPFRGFRDLAFFLEVSLDSLLVWASSEGSDETARMRRLAWTFAARIGDKYQIRLTRSISCQSGSPRGFIK